jgi:hypothetical protein
LAGKRKVAVSTDKRRTWGELRDTAERLQEEVEQRERAAAEAERIQELQHWSQRAEQTWRHIDTLIQEKSTRAYDEATTLLIRMREVAVYQDRLAQFEARLAELQTQYPKRPALQDRLRKVAQLQ